MLSGSKGRFPINIYLEERSNINIRGEMTHARRYFVSFSGKLCLKSEIPTLEGNYHFELPHTHHGDKQLELDPAKLCSRKMVHNQTVLTFRSMSYVEFG